MMEKSRIEKEILIPYLKENPEELEKLVKRLVELKPLAAEFIRCYFILKMYAESSDKIKTVTDEDVAKIAQVLAKIL